MARVCLRQFLAARLFAGFTLLVFVMSAMAAPNPGGAFPDVLSEDVARFSALLRSRAPERRIEGIQGLSHLKHWPAEEALLPLLRDPDARVRAETISALTRLGTAKSLPALIGELENPVWENRRNAWLGLERMTAENFGEDEITAWRKWWEENSAEVKAEKLLAVALKPAPVAAPGTNDTPDAAALVRSGNRPRRLRSAPGAPASPERRAALRALIHLSVPAQEGALIGLLEAPQTPPLDAAERGFVCEALERVGTARAIPILARQHLDAAAWALARIGGAEAERALLADLRSLPALLALDHLRSTNAGRFLPQLVGQMGLITFRGQPDDVMNEELQPIQRVGANLIRRSGLASAFAECVLQELEATMQPPVTREPRRAIPPEWEAMFKAMRSELKPGFVREDGTTTTQPVAALCYMADDPALAKRLIPLLRHPAYVVRVYVALTLGRLHAREALPEIRAMLREGYPFSDSVALASGKHFDQSQTVRWRGFLCMGLGRMGGEEARAALEEFAGDPSRPRDIRYSAVVGLGFIASPRSLPVLDRVAREDIIWMVRDEARRAAEAISILEKEREP